MRRLGYCVATQRCRDRASGTESLKSPTNLCITCALLICIDLQRYCYAYGTLTGTATLLLRNADARTRGRDDTTSVLGVGAMSYFESK